MNEVFIYISYEKGIASVPNHETISFIIASTP